MALNIIPAKQRSPYLPAFLQPLSPFSYPSSLSSFPATIIPENPSYPVWFTGFVVSSACLFPLEADNVYSLSINMGTDKKIIVTRKLNFEQGVVASWAPVSD